MPVQLRALLIVAAMLPHEGLADDFVTIAVASNFASTALELVQEFSAQSGVQVRISSGSTGKLYAQIINGAPFDIFLAADSARPELLEQTGHIAAGSRFTYATGALVLWSRDERLQGRNCREALQEGEYDRLALANPKTAPYGSAAREFLVNAGLWESASRRAVFGENIAQTLQFVASGNATLGFIARSQLSNSKLPNSTCTWVVPAALHSPLRQQAVLLKRSHDNQFAVKFVRFLRMPAAEEIIVRHGYGISR